MNFNQCTFIGNTGSAPKVLTTGSGKAFAKFRLAVHGYAKDEAQEPLWFTVLIWREDLAKTAADILKKGALVLVSGRCITNYSLHCPGRLPGQCGRCLPTPANHLSPWQHIHSQPVLLPPKPAPARYFSFFLLYSTAILGVTS